MRSHPIAAGALARHILLEAPSHAGAVRYLTGLHVQLEDGKTSSWVTVTRTGTFSDPRYGQFAITRDMLLQMVANFEARVLGQDVFIDVSHRPDNGAAGKVLKLSVEGDRLRAQVEWTPYGLEAIRDRGYQYLSAEYHEQWIDNEQHKQHGCVLLGAGLTVRPVVKRLDPIQLSETGDVPVLIHPELQTRLLQETHTMWKQLLDALRARLQGVKLSDAVVGSLVAAAEKALGSTTDEAAARALVAGFETAGLQLGEQIGAQSAVINLSVPGTAGLTADDVRRVLAEEAAAQATKAKQLADDVTAKRKLLTDAIDAGQGLDTDLKRQLAADVADLVGPGLSDDQVRALAANQLKRGHELVAARALVSMGYRVAGTTHISVDSANDVRALQEAVDRRLGILNLSDARRYERTGGALQPENKAYAERVLAEFDAANGHRLANERKLLAAGDGIVSDVAVPAIFERTVIREALYDLVGLQFYDVGTVPFSASALIPYSYRDTTAAGRSSTRKYEGQSIARAGVKQTSETVYPIPQKIAFEVSDELRYLTSNGQLDWDSVAENARNASRIVGEDLEKLLFDEVLDAADQYAVTAVTTEAVGTGNGSKSIWPVAQFPVARPKKVYDLQGNQVGSTLYPITITVNAVGINEYDFTGTQSAGTYWWMDYNLGEIHFVNQAGAVVNITNTHAIVCSYSYTTNVYKFDTDLGSLATEAKWDDFLYRYGLRKNIIEQDRYYTANFGVMSGTVRTQIEQARSFAANYAREGTSLQTNGNLGVVKGIANFRTTAPGLVMGDQRVVIGARGTSRFRMMKPWAMGELQNQTDSNGRFTGKKEAYGDQFVVCMTPAQLKGAYTSLVLYGAGARISR